MKTKTDLVFFTRIQIRSYLTHLSALHKSFHLHGTTNLAHLVQAHDNMTDFAKVFNIYPIGSDQEDIHDTEHIKRANASVNQDFSKTYVRITIKIPQMRTGLNWRKFIREPKNGLISKATYHGTRVYFEFLLNQGKPNEITYEFSPQEPFRGPIEYNKSYLKYKDDYVLWFVHKPQPW